MWKSLYNMLSGYVLIITIVVGLVTLVMKQRHRLKLPGPPRLPLVGNVLQMGTTKVRRSDEVLADWTKQYGPAYTVNVFGTEWVFVGGYDEIYEVMITKGRSFAGRHKWYRYGYATYGFKNIVLGDPMQPQWLPMRKTAFRALHQHGAGLNRIETVLAAMAKDFVGKTTSYNGKPIDLRDDVYNFVAKVAVVMFVGRQPEDDDVLLIETKRFEELAREVLNPISGIEFDYFPWLRFFGHPMWKKLLEVCALRDSLWEKLWSESQQTYSPEGEATCMMHFIAQLLDKYSQFYEKTMNIEHAKGLFFDLVGGSIATTNNFAYALPNILLHNPDVLRKLREEIDHVIGFDRSPSIFDRDAMPYASATIYELLRFGSLVAAMGHVTLEDTSIGDIPLPAGTPVICLINALHYDEAFWRDPKVFRPERFLDDSGNLLPPDDPHRKRLLPFGAGTRVCVGEVFAIRRLFIFATSLVQAFDLEPADKMVQSDYASWKDGIILSPKSYTIKLIPRKRIGYSKN